MVKRSASLRDSPHDDDDAQIVSLVAADYVTRMGRGAVAYLRLEEALSAGEGDALSAKAWRDIGDAAALILSRLH